MKITQNGIDLSLTNREVKYLADLVGGLSYGDIVTKMELSPSHDDFSKELFDALDNL